MDTSNQDKEKPNFDFIIKQDADQQKPQHPRDKKVVILVALCIITFLLFVGAALFSSEQNVSQESGSVVTAPATPEEQNIVKQFLGLVASNKPDEAYALVDPSGITSEEFTDESLPFLSSLNLAECTIGNTKSSSLDSNSTDASTTLYILASCKQTDDNTQITLEFLVEEQDGKTVITGYSMEDTQ